MLQLWGIIVLWALVALAAAAGVVVLSRPRRGLPRTIAPGSLPQARGFEAAAERHFGNPRTLGTIGDVNRWPECP